MRIKLSFISLLFIALSLPLQSSVIDPAAQEVIDNYIEATGGREAKGKVKTAIYLSSYKIPTQGLDAQLKAYFKMPNKFRGTISVTNFGDTTTAFDGDTGWEQSPITGFRVVEGPELEQMKRDGVLFPALSLTDQYKKIERAPDEDGLIVLKLTTPTNFEEFWKFDPDTHLLMKMDTVVDAGVQGSFPLNTEIFEYMESDGIKVPSKSIISNPAITVELSITEISYNVEISDEIFAQPE